MGAAPSSPPPPAADQPGPPGPFYPSNAMESPYFGWIVPHAWQEPDYGSDFEPDEPEIDDDVDEEGYLITKS